MLMPRWELRHTSNPMDKSHFKGGDGGAGQAREDEQARQSKVQSATDTINAIFNGKKQATGKRYTRSVNNDVFGGIRVPRVAERLSEADFSAKKKTWENSQKNPAVTSPNLRNSINFPRFDFEGQPIATTPQQESGGFNPDEWQEESYSYLEDDPSNSRQKTYSEVSDATKQLNLRELGKMFTQASNNNLYGLARSGLLGGSVDAESGADLQTRFGEGQIRAEKAGMEASSQLKMQDEKTRQNLIGLAQSGIDTGSAATMAANQMSASADAARSANNTSSLQGLFDGMTQAYLQKQQTQAMQPRGSYGGGFSNPFGTNSYSGNYQ